MTPRTQSGKGETLDHILATLGSVAEGTAATSSDLPPAVRGLVDVSALYSQSDQVWRPPKGK